jgi:hypothetical protein
MTDLAFIPYDVAVPFIYFCSIFGMMWGGYCIHRVASIDINDSSKFKGAAKEDAKSINGEAGEYSPSEILESMKFCNETITAVSNLPLLLNNREFQDHAHTSPIWCLALLFLIYYYC